MLNNPQQPNPLDALLKQYQQALQGPVPNPNALLSALWPQFTPAQQELARAALAPRRKVASNNAEGGRYNALGTQQGTQGPVSGPGPSQGTTAPSGGIPGQVPNGTQAFADTQTPTYGIFAKPIINTVVQAGGADAYAKQQSGLGATPGQIKTAESNANVQTQGGQAIPAANPYASLGEQPIPQANITPQDLKRTVVDTVTGKTVQATPGDAYSFSTTGMAPGKYAPPVNATVTPNQYGSSIVGYNVDKNGEAEPILREAWQAPDKTPGVAGDITYKDSE